jgi:hypothetical protein
MQPHKVLLYLLWILAFVVDYFDQRYFFYFYNHIPYTIAGITFHFSVFLRYPLAAVKWWITAKMIPHWFQNSHRKMAIIFLGLILIDSLLVLGIKYEFNHLTSIHSLIYNIIRLKPFNNYFLGFLAGLTILYQFNQAYENSNIKGSKD